MKSFGSLVRFGCAFLGMTTFRVRFSFLCALLTLPGASFRLVGQVQGTGTIQGTVTDSSGAAIVGAAVTVTQPDTGRSLSRVTSDAGIYVASALSPGTYTVEVRAAGFHAVVQDKVVVNAISVVGLNFSLNVGTEDQAVVVTAAPPSINTQNGSLDTTIPSSTYTALPLAMNGSPKNPLGFQTLVPGVSPGQFGIVNINGGPDATAYLYVNGMPLLSARAQGDTSLVTLSTSTEVVDQFQIISSGIPAYYVGQGITNFVTKSGSNDFHGDVYENFRNTALDAAGYFSTKVPVEHQNEWGGSVGGRILRDRLFFFANVDRFKIVNGNNPSFNSIPTTAARTGDFSGFPTPIYDPDTTQCSGGVCTRQQFPGNVIPPDRISSISNTLQAKLPPVQNDGLQNNFANAYTSGRTQNMYMGKLDANITPSQRAFVQFQYGHAGDIGLPPGSTVLPLPYASSYYISNDMWVGQIGHTWTITPHLLNVFGAQYSLGYAPQSNPGAGGNYPGEAGLSGLPPGEPSRAFPMVYFGGPNAPTMWDWIDNTISYIDTTSALVYQDTLQWVHGKHSVTFGGQAILQHDDVYSANTIDFNFNNTETAGFDSSGGIVATTGNAYASYLLGDVDSASATDSAAPKSHQRYKDYAAYVQDDWKLTPKLVFNLGLRYIVPVPWSDQGNRSSWLDPNTPNPAVGGYPGVLQFDGDGANSCHCDHPIETHYLTFDPRIGAAYSVTDKTVVRGAYGINHFNGGALGGMLEAGGGTLGYSADPNFLSPDAGITPAFNWNNGFPAYTRPPFFDPTAGAGYSTTMGATASGLGYIRPKTAGRAPYTENWNLTFERGIASDMTWSLSYAGSQSHFIGINGGVGAFSDQIDPKYLALGNLLQQPLNSSTLAQAQAVFPDIQMPYPNFVGSLGQALRPFPQYAYINDLYSNFGSANYNSLQTSLQKRMSRGLYFLASYTWAKNINFTGGTLAWIYAAPRSAYNIGSERSVAYNDVPHLISLAYVYALPFGRGHSLSTNSRVIDAVIGGWQLSGIQQYSAGTPLGTISGSCNVPYTGGCYANYGSSKQARINGSIGSGDPRSTPYLDVNAFANAAPFTFGNTSRTMAYGLRNSWNLNENFSLGKDFHAMDRMTVRVQADAFNAFNRTTFGGISTNITSSNFGYVGGQTNQPRQLQLEAYIKF